MPVLSHTSPQTKKPAAPWLSDRAVWLGAALVFLVSFGVYLTSLSSIFWDDDSPETVAAAYSLGIQHPPGYALWALVQRVFSLLPVGNICFRVNLASALAGSLTTVLLWILISRLLPKVVSRSPSRVSSFSLQCCAVSCALAAAFSRTFWEKSLGPKGLVYGGEALVIVSILLCLERFTRERETQPQGNSFLPWAGLAFFLFGLGCCGHWQTQVLFSPLLFPFFRGAFSRWRRKVSLVRKLLLVLALFFIGLSPLLVLPLRAHLHPVLNLGAPDHASLFAKSFLREYYQYREKGLGPAVLDALRGRTSWEPVKQLGQIILNQQGIQIPRHFLEEMKPLMLLLALAGLGAWWKSGERILMGVLLGSLVLLLAALLSASWIVPGPIAAWYADNYLLPVNWITAIFAAVGLYALGNLGGRLGKAGLYGKWLGWTAALLILPLPLWWSNHAGLSMTRQTLHYDYGVNLMKSLPENSVFFAEGDEDYFTLYYLQIVEKRREDIVMIPSFTLFETWGVEQVERLHPSLGLTDSPTAYPDPYHRIESAFNQIMAQAGGRQPMGYSYFDGAFHRYYLASHPSLLCEKSGILLLLASKDGKAYPALPLRFIRARHWADNPSNAHPALQGIWNVYDLAAQPSSQGKPNGL